MKRYRESLQNEGKTEVLHGGLDLGQLWGPQQVKLSLSVWDTVYGNSATIIFYLCLSVSNFQIPSREKVLAISEKVNRVLQTLVISLAFLSSAIAISKPSASLQSMVLTATIFIFLKMHSIQWIS